MSVLALDTYRAVGTLSRYARYVRVPDPLVAEDAFIDYLMDVGTSFAEPPVLFPTNDHWAAAISRHRDALARYYRPCVAEWPVVSLLINKPAFYAWATERGYPVPRAWSIDDLDSIPKDAFPLVAKPTCRRFASNDNTSSRLATMLDDRRLTVIRDREELHRFAQINYDMLSYMMLQDYVEGLSDCMYTIGVYANQAHEVLGMFTGRKLRGFPPDSGDCIVGQAAPIPEYLKQLVRRMCKELGYHGIAEFEFKRSAGTGEYRLIEINPRSWSWIGITPFCGISLPWLAYADLTGLEMTHEPEDGAVTDNVKWVRITDDCLNCLYLNRRRGFPQWHMSPRQWWRSLAADKLVVAEFSRDDLLPSLYPLYSLARRTAKWVLRR